MTHKRQVFLTASQVDLVLVGPEDAETISNWFNDSEVTAYLARGSFPMTVVSEQEYLEKMYKDQSQLMLGIFHRKDQKLIGVTGLHQINQLNQNAVFGICIGEKEYWGKGIGTEVLTRMLTYAFSQANLRTVRLSVLGNNPRGKRCYEKCGFALVGTYPKYIFKDGAWHDEHLMIAQNPIYKRT